MAEHEHLPRLGQIWDRQPVYFITTCTAKRQRLLATDVSHAILRNEWAEIKPRYGWMIGRYVIMPDHVHFFATPTGTAPMPLSRVIGKWKEWSAKRLLSAIKGQPPLWQPEFFDHLLRSSESRAAKWDYVQNNPVRAGLAATPADWPYAGAVDFE